MAQNVYLISGPSGSGKTSLTQALLKRTEKISRAVTVTTRQQREGEINGVHYQFVNRTQFVELERAGELLETDYSYNEWYATPRTVLDSEDDVVLIVTVPGALALKQAIPYAKMLFILPPCARTAAQRVAERSCANEKERIDNYDTEVAAARHFDHVFLNLDFEETVQRMCDYVLHCRKERVTMQSQITAGLREELHV
jgi:guanylate kinase